MTFLATYDGVLRPGRRGAGEGWPAPWGFRCDDCGAILPYGCVLLPREHRTAVTEAREVGPDLHRCGACEGFVERPSLWGAA